MRKLTVLGLVVLMASGGIGNAQDNKKEELKPTNAQPNKKIDSKAGSEKMLFPIEMQRGGTDKRPTQDYFYEGQRIRDFQQLKEVIDSLNDPEASRLLKDSANKETIGTVFFVTSGLLLAGGVIYAIAAPGSTVTSPGLPFPYSGPTTTHLQPDSTPYWVLGVSGAVVALIGLIFASDAGQCRQDAVTRYNHVIESDQNLSMILLPYTELPGLELTQRF